MCWIRESLLLLVVITEEQQSYIRSMSLIELEPKEIQSQQRIRNKILFGKPQACMDMIRCGLLSSTFWADLKTLRIIRESQTSDMPTNSDSMANAVRVPLVLLIKEEKIVKVWLEEEKLFEIHNQKKPQFLEYCKANNLILKENPPRQRFVAISLK
ncbi:hypothetical protein AVEN_85282-1 [Araneus ventricosus]|uniref:Uncharacterized protein n=1 Tax=Araneus ventricosus TaxID=182803 RepID=A0A4Y2JZT1_ARAVE|nr:hypothetical protein AVEN_85282-1 [Araneus ventricosus]